MTDQTRRNLMRWVSCSLSGVAFLLSARAPLLSQSVESMDVDSIVEQFMIRQHVPGLAIHVERGGVVLVSRAYGWADVEGQVPTGTDTEFPVASITKPFTATLALRLVEQGRLDLDSPLRRYLPDLPSWSDTMTARHLLMHTSGIRDYFGLPGWDVMRRGELTPAEVIALFVLEPLEFAPGAEFRYSNSNYFLLGSVIERVTGEPYAQALQRAVLEPLRLEETSYCDPRDGLPFRARGYLWESGADAAQVGEYTHPNAVYAAGGLCSTARDLGRFGTALHSGAVLGRETLAEMEKAWEGTRAAGNGMGLFAGELGGHRVVSHGGALRSGYEGHFAVFPDDSLVVVVLSNQYFARTSLIADRVAGRVLGVPEPEVYDLRLEPQERAVYVGVYDLGGSSRMRVVDEGGTLYGSGQALLYQGDHTFVRAEDQDTQVIFTVERGQAVAVEVVRRGTRVLSGPRLPGGRP